MCPRPVGLAYGRWQKCLNEPLKRHPLPWSQHEGYPCALTGQRESGRRVAWSTGSEEQPGVGPASPISTRTVLSGLQ